MLNIASQACSPYPWLHCLAGILQIPRNSAHPSRCPSLAFLHLRSHTAFTSLLLPPKFRLEHQATVVPV